MRVESKVTSAVGAGRDEAWFEEGMNKVALLIKRLDDLNALQRGRKESDNEDWKAAEIARSDVLEETASSLAALVAQLSPRSFLPKERLTTFVEVARSSGLLPLRRDFERTSFPPEDEQAKVAEAPVVSTSAPAAVPANPPAPLGERANEFPRADVAQQVGNGFGGAKRKRNYGDPSSGAAVAARTHRTPAFTGTTHLPLIQRIVQNFAPRGGAVGLETGVGAGDCLKSLSALALQPRSIVAGSLPVNKAATALLYRLRERGTRDVFTEQVRQMEAEAKLEEEKRMKELDTRLPEHDKLAVMLQAAFQRQKEREAALGNSYTLEMMRMVSRVRSDA